MQHNRQTNLPSEMPSRSCSHLPCSFPPANPKSSLNSLHKSAKFNQIQPNSTQLITRIYMAADTWSQAHVGRFCVVNSGAGARASARLACMMAGKMWMLGGGSLICGCEFCFCTCSIGRKVQLEVGCSTPQQSVAELRTS